MQQQQQSAPSSVDVSRLRHAFAVHAASCASLYACVLALRQRVRRQSSAVQQAAAAGAPQLFVISGHLLFSLSACVCVSVCALLLFEVTSRRRPISLCVCVSLYVFVCLKMCAMTAKKRTKRRSQINNKRTNSKNSCKQAEAAAQTEAGVAGG